MRTQWTSNQFTKLIMFHLFKCLSSFSISREYRLILLLFHHFKVSFRNRLLVRFALWTLKREERKKRTEIEYTFIKFVLRAVKYSVCRMQANLFATINVYHRNLNFKVVSHNKYAILIKIYKINIYTELTK